MRSLSLRTAAPPTLPARALVRVVDGEGIAHSLRPGHSSNPTSLAANPTSSILSGAMMLNHLGEYEAAARIDAAVDTVFGSGTLPLDLGGKANTEQLVSALIDAM